MPLNKETETDIWNHLTVCKQMINFGAVANVLNCGLEVSEFDLQLRYYVHFRTNITGKSMNPLIIQAMG